MPGTICDILPSAAAVLGVPDAPDPLGLRDRLGPRRRVVVILVDGLGYHLLPELAGHAPLLASVLRGGTGDLDELGCTFPSTTPTSLVSLATGVWPGEHGVLGFTVRVPGSGRVLTHITWRGDPEPARWQPVPTWFERTARAGVPAVTVLPAVFEGSGLTVAAYRGARFVGVTDREPYADRLLAELHAGPGLLYGYIADLDTAAHRDGVGSPAWQQAAQRADALLSRVAEALPPDAALLVTADHGGLNSPATGRYDLDADARLAAGVQVVAGEPRARYLHVRAGAAPDVLAAWQGVLGPHADVITRDDAIAAGLFGPVPDAHRERIGDVIVICRDDAVVLAGAHEPPEVGTLVGFHGALTPAETAIPLITLAG